MGIPQFFRWLNTRYPRIIIDAPRTPVDNLYLDLNGLIHPCYHPPDRKLQSIDQVFLEMFALMDRVIAFVRPSKLVYVAVDGSAPRAKLAQQRKRRFISAYERQQSLLTKSNEEVGEDEEDNFEHEVLNDADEKKEFIFAQAPANDLDYLLSDSNAITPGTPFMRRLRQALVYYVSTRRGVTFILDDCNVPGEGEHKIMAFIRSQRAALGYDPTTTHCVYGLDADLIMLALTSHEPNFYILRDQINMDRNKKLCQGCGALISTRSNHPADLEHLRKCPEFKHEGDPPIAFSKQFLTVDIGYFRKYLYKEFREPSNFERVIDDFVFLCFLAGNDFLPHITSLRIDDGGIIRIISLYNEIREKRCNKDVYFTDNGKVNYAVFLPFLEELAKREHGLMLQMKAQESRRNAARTDMKIAELATKIKQLPPGCKESQILKEELALISAAGGGLLVQDIQVHNRRFDEQDIDPDDPVKILLHYQYHECNLRAENYQESFYGDSLAEVDVACASFLRGMAWVCHYYARGCCDWGWTYDSFIAPLVEDMASYLRVHLKEFEQLEFDRNSRPLLPYQQLLAVLPPFSAHLLPKALQPLMLDPKSPLRQFYPNRIECDATHAHALWAAEVLLPPVDVALLIRESDALMNQCSQDEIDENMFSDPIVVYQEHKPKIEECIAQAGAGNRPLGRIANYQQAYNGFYGRITRYWPPQDAYLAYKKCFKTVADFITDRTDRGDYWYAYLPEVAVRAAKYAYRFSPAKPRDDFILSRCLLRQDILFEFNMFDWERGASRRQDEERQVWRAQ